MRLSVPKAGLAIDDNCRLRSGMTKGLLSMPQRSFVLSNHMWKNHISANLN